MSFEQLIEDAEFMNWVLAPSDISNSFWKDFLDTYPENKEAVGRAKEFLLATKYYFETDDKNDDYINNELQKIVGGSILSVSQKQEKSTTYKKYSNNIRHKIAIAACIAILFTSVIWLYKTQVSIPDMDYKTDFAEWKTIKLPDESTVNLNSNSNLKIDKNWSKDSIRKVWLEGEAFFKVEKKIVAKSKFQVITKGIIIEVLGTQFNVQNRGDITEVFLKEGKIKLKMNGKEEYLFPGDFISYSAIENKIIKRNKVPQESYTTWKDGTLQMEGTVKEIFLKIKEIYGVQIQISDTTILKEVRKISIPMKDMETVVPILEVSLNIKIILDNNKLIIK